jgi:hypothetical protein
VGEGARSSGAKQLEHEANHSSPSVAKVKNAWSYIFMAVLHLHCCLMTVIQKMSSVYVMAVQIRTIFGYNIFKLLI